MKPTGSILYLSILAKDLAIHPIAQKKLSPHHLRKIADNLDLDSIGVVHVVKYRINGMVAYWVVDGQHRIKALIQRGLGDWPVMVAFHEDVTADSAASALFLRLGNRSSVAPHQTFKNQVTAGEPVAVGVVRVMESFGVSVGDQSGNGKASCVVSLKSSYVLDGGKSLVLAMSCITQAWGTDAAAMEGNVIHGISLLFAKHGAMIDGTSLCKKLAKSGTPSSLIGVARSRRGLNAMGRTIAQTVATVVINLYNAGRSTGRIPQ